MTNPYLTLHDLSFVLPDGRPLFADLNETFDASHTGVVGRNGVAPPGARPVLTGPRSSRRRPTIPVGAALAAIKDAEDRG
ncbi:hypothetical protein [Alloalcanivorax gelatiniphagus]|uniref:Uncharacterized protein n=1 Tax=Alloalcanivorax gelatiniphagus TaxID=1194167 RepID=A0ABY2XPL9_9GAMM|nr:hypothetical protein [Alloalcanivorax gelatiniphagus]TMW14073.1 hypothetical protein FGS76_03850 [Alloalcanivorax gelatiniphagus]